CFSCHMYDTSDYGSVTGGNSKTIFVHGQNKRFYYRETDGSISPLNQLADAFINGYIADIDFINRECWSENRSGYESKANCGRGHNAEAYAPDP
ncbi:MAG: hypothetical protein ACE5NJ_00480, partial [Thermodesulfobacteriota bacterium]